MNERLARSAARVLELDEEPVREDEDGHPERQRKGEHAQRAQHRLSPARPGELYKVCMFSLLAVAQLAWLAAIAYGIFVVAN
jgi:hypothetical protein